MTAMHALTDLTSIDWDQLWERRMQQSSWTKNCEKWWDERAETFNRDVRQSEYANKMIARMGINPDSTILDIGCGPGTLAIPMAKQVKSVTALDMSAEMLQFVMKNARAEGLTNITCLQHRWEDIIIGRDIELHDLVVASRSFPEQSPRKALRQMNNAARKGVYVTMWANGDEYETFYQLTYTVIGKDYCPPPDYIYIYNILYQEGIRANIEFIEYVDHLQYAGIDDAMEDWRWRIKPENDDQKNRLKHHLQQQFVKNEESMMEKNLKCRWALIHWQKAGD